MKHLLCCTIALVATHSAAALAEEAPAPGKRIFDRYCAECHARGVGHPGAQQLGRTRGEPFALLEQRKDLSASYIRQVVRRGLLEMPPFRPSEIDAEALGQLADYLAKSALRDVDE